MPAIGNYARPKKGPLSLDVKTETGLLIDTLEIVEPTKKCSYVPNHILETKLFAKVGKNELVHSRPATVQFEGFTTESKHIQNLSIVNASTEVVSLHIIPPQTKHFSIKYDKNKRMGPGLTLECSVEFIGDEYRYYYDCIRVHCQGEENLLIPLHAYPVLDLKQFPQNFIFPAVPVGESICRKFPIKCNVPVDFEYQLELIKQHPFLSIEPLSGTVPGNGQVDISVTFSPCEFLTAQLTVQLITSQFNSKPILCNFTGSSAPGLLKYVILLFLRIYSIYAHHQIYNFYPYNIFEIIQNGIKFPAVIDTPHAVAQVLNQQPGKLKAKDVRENLTSQKDSKKATSRQMKEALFEQAVRKNVYEERQNQLRWQVKLGDEQIKQSKRVQILEERDQAWDIYKFTRRQDPVEDKEYNRLKTEIEYRRTMRPYNQVIITFEDAKFDLYTNDLWAVRHAALDKFIQAARKIIIRNRGEAKLKSLRRVVIDWSKKKYTMDKLTSEQQEKIEEDEEKEELPTHFDISANKIQHYTFPTYIPPDVKDDMAPDAIGVVPFMPTEVVVKKKVQYFSLKVPQHYHLNGYNIHNVQNASTGYIPVKLIRPLREGAEEVEELDEVESGEEIPEIEVIEDQKTEAESDIKSSAVFPPKALFNPVEYPQLHIFNPAPGLQVFHAPSKYSEVSAEYHLCPLPKYATKEPSNSHHTSTQRKYLDREDIIRGTQTWKKFPSQGLITLSNTPTLSNVWVPRWLVVLYYSITVITC
ncbi:hypothetical protein LOTGIDRAFT_144748 [Lottia gigantea]|uniref:Cilia- and flagella-associated protein 221 n=1 Tax=Lottia gigantea TaxID=225164 RepID=V4AEA6_LOTGI|nr:hypothetical protein LOTGIDRAFT_144748 [Lottia gigantea]ESO95222.1 hypothetical protein LOTGIDRAFT_144748 [Lottia gigantea]